MRDSVDQQPVEQAIFTSGSSGSARGYRIVAQSVGIGAADAAELAAWGPSHDSMIDSNSGADSLNFHPLPSGAYCLSRTQTVDGACNNGGRRVFTHCLVVAPETLARFGNNPFALFRAASIQRVWLVDEPTDALMEPLRMPGGAAPVDEALLSLMAADPGPENLAALVQAAHDNLCLAVGGTPSPASLMAGLFSCLPSECRLEFSFSTGLKFSPRRPFRLVALSGDPAERCWVAGYSNVAVLELQCGVAPQSLPLDGWGQLILRALRTGQISFLSAQLSKRRFSLSLADLPVLGLQLQEELDAVDLGGRRPIEESATMTAPAARSAHAAHRRFSKNNPSAPTATAAASPSADFKFTSPEVLEKLEHLDDLVYESIDGQPGALEQLQTAWPKLLGQLGEEMVAESREQYLRYALSIWDEYSDADGLRQSGRAINALDVLCLLFSGME